MLITCYHGFVLFSCVFRFGCNGLTRNIRQSLKFQVRHVQAAVVELTGQRLVQLACEDLEYPYIAAVM
jgi:hypothetical protein